ncbi:MAG: rRNA maturation RNase YbeY [Alcanivoracaceae bacterium]
MIEIQRAAADAGTPADSQLQDWAIAALAAVRRDGDITLRLVDEHEMTRLNTDYRGKQGPTNVLSFPFEAPEGLPEAALPALLGDIIICPDVVSGEAEQQGKTHSAHWAHMVVHGVLHLCGYDHQARADAEQMEALETDILGAAGFADPYTTEEA